MQEQENVNPAKNYSTNELVEHKEYCINFIECLQKKISSNGGWIAREENLRQIEIARKEMEIIENELSIRIG